MNRRTAARKCGTDRRAVQVKLTDPQAITAQARESSYRWAGDRVQLER
jgi:hypothetical protein